MATARAGNVIGGGDWADDRLIPDLVWAITKTNWLTISTKQRYVVCRKRKWFTTLLPACLPHLPARIARLLASLARLF